MDKKELINLLIKAYNNKEVDIEKMGIKKIDYNFKKGTIYLTTEEGGTHRLHKNNLVDNPSLGDKKGLEIWDWIRK